MIYIAIDPGLTGALAAIDDASQLVLCADLPVIRDHKLAWIDAGPLASLLLQCRDGRPAQLTVERSQAMPGQGVASTFCTGAVLGSILATAQGLAVPLHLVTAAAWTGT
jgi:crossover junction endodeoxyribonuclease RuvC